MLQRQKRFGKIKILQFLLKLFRKSDFSNGFWPIPLTASSHQLLFPRVVQSCQSSRPKSSCLHCYSEAIKNQMF